MSCIRHLGAQEGRTRRRRLIVLLEMQTNPTYIGGLDAFVGVVVSVRRRRDLQRRQRDNRQHCEVTESPVPKPLHR